MFQWGGVALGSDMVCKALSESIASLSSMFLLDSPRFPLVFTGRNVELESLGMQSARSSQVVQLVQRPISYNNNPEKWRAPGIQINVPAIYPNALPSNITPSSSPGYLTPAASGSTCGRNGYITPAFSGVPNTRTKKWGKGGTTGGEIGENCARRARRANVLSQANCLEMQRTTAA